MKLSIFSHINWPSVCLWKNSIFRSSAHFLIRFFISNYVSFQCILDINPLWSVSFANNFSHSVGFLFLFWWWFPLLCKSFLVWCSPIYLFLHFLPLSEEKDPKLLLRPTSISVLPIFSSRSFMVSGLTVTHCWWKLNWWSHYGNQYENLSKN